MDTRVAQWLKWARDKGDPPDEAFHPILTTYDFFRDEEPYMLPGLYTELTVAEQQLVRSHRDVGEDLEISGDVYELLDAVGDFTPEMQLMAEEWLEMYDE